MLVTVYVVVPNRGSVRVLFNTIWRSAEYHRSETTWRAFSFPICPAGMVCVVRVPSATRTLIVCVPSDSFFSNPAASSFCRCPSIRPANPEADSEVVVDPFPPCWWNAEVCATLFSLSSMMCTPATGSEIETIVFGAPDAVSGPNPVNVASCRDLPWLSRYTDTCDVRCSTEPSCNVDVVSDVAVAENGAPLTTLPPCIPSKPINSIGAPKGGPSGPCLCACTAAELNTSAPLNTTHIFILGLILPSPLLSQPRRVVRRGNVVSVFFLRQPHCLRQPVVSYQQVHLDPLASTLFIHRQSKRAKRTALHPHAQYCRLFRLLQRRPWQRRKFSRIVSTGERRRHCVRCLVLPRRTARHERVGRGHFLFRRIETPHLQPIPRTYRAHENCCRSQGPRRHDRG